MKFTEKTLTEEAVEDALGLVTTIDDNDELAAILMSYVLSYLGDKKDFRRVGKRERNAIEAFVGAAIHQAIENPDGNIARILSKRGFLIPEIVGRFRFDIGSH